MALPVLAGIPWLAGIIGAAFTSLFTFFAQHLTKRVAVSITVILSLVGITSAFFATITGMINAISYVAPPSITAGMALIVPSNATACITAVVTAHTIRYAYAWQFRIIQYKMF
tara:strand:+ start:94820 stop:95158 length:339 start_codon:yes stop_codon:yes gene_type:complete